MALIHLLGVLKDNLRLVFLSACHSNSLAKTLADIIPYTIGMGGAIADDAAIAFAAAFYRALGFGRSLQDAFDLGQNALMNLQFPEDHTPRLYSRKGAADPAKLVLAGPSIAPLRALSAVDDRAQSPDGAVRECRVEPDDWNKNLNKIRSKRHIYDVFVSYPRQHWDLVEPLVTLLKVGNRYVFQDIKEILPGEHREETILRALRGAKKVVVIWCSHAQESRRVEKETTIAVAEKKTVIPVVLDATPLPERLKQFQWVDFSSFMRHVDTRQAQKWDEPEEDAEFLVVADPLVIGIPLIRTGCLVLFVLSFIFLIGWAILHPSSRIFSVFIIAIVLAGICYAIIMMDWPSPQSLPDGGSTPSDTMLKRIATQQSHTGITLARIVMEEVRKLDLEGESEG
jgi:hypothetical protein